MLNERKKVKLVWSNNAYLERKKRGPYLTGKTKNQPILTNMDPVALSQRLPKELKK